LHEQSFSANEDIILTAEASDADGTISKVEYFSGEKKLGEQTSSPWSFTWQNVPAGNYSLTAVATDDRYASTASLPVQIDVKLPLFTDVDSDIMNLYPNPNDGRFFFETVVPLQDINYILTISALDGRSVYNEKLHRAEKITRFFDLSFLKPGIYIIKLTGKHIINAREFIKR
jgi:hypothetical protein